MIALLIAFQLTTTQCYANGAWVNCTSNTPQPIAPLQSAPDYYGQMMAPLQRQQAIDAQRQQLGAELARERTAGLRARVGKLLAAGDCAGAEQYALRRGEFALVQTVRDYCAAAPMHSDAPQAAADGPRKVRARTASGYCLDVPPGYVGTGAVNSPSVTSAMPRCDGLSGG